MKKIMMVIAFCSFFLIQNGFSQNRFTISLGGGYIPPKLSDEKLTYWDTGSLFGLSAGWQVSNKTEMVLSASYQKHQYADKHRGGIVPAVFRQLISKHTENSTVYDLSLATRWTMSSKQIKPFIGTGVGLLLIDQGKIEATYQMDSNSDPTTTVYSDSDKEYTVAAFNLDLGYEIGLKENVALVLEGELIVGFNGPIYTPITAAIKVVL